MSYFALRQKVTNLYAKVKASFNEDTGRTEYELYPSGDIILSGDHTWLARSRKEAETVSMSNPERRSTSIHSPGNEWIGEWIVTELDLPSK